MDPTQQPTSLDSIQRLLSQNRQELGKRVADLPRTEENIRAGTFENDQTLNTLRQNQQQKILELYQHDKMIAQQYANPESNLYLKDPYQREMARATQFQGTAGELGAINNQIAGRRDVLGDTMEKALKLAQYGIQAKQIENQLLQQEFENELKKTSAGGLNDLLSLPELQALNLPYGTTKSQAAKMQLTPSAQNQLSATDKNRLNNWQAAGSQIQDIEQSFNMNKNAYGTIPGLTTTAAQGKLGGNIPFIGGLVSGAAQGIGSQMVNPTTLNMDAKLNALRSSVINALSRSGSAASQEIISQYVPSVYDSPQVFESKLMAAKGLINYQYESIAGSPFFSNMANSSNPLGGVSGLQPPSYFVPDSGMTATDY